MLINLSFDKHAEVQSRESTAPSLEFRGSNTGQRYLRP